MVRGILWLLFVALFFTNHLVASDEEGTDEGTDEYGAHVIGIDLGTTYSCVGVFKNGRVEIMQNEQGNRITPSYVAFTQDGQRLIGDPAKNQLTSNPENTVFDAKRLIGRLYKDENIQKDVKYWPFKVVEKSTRPFVEVTLGGQKKSFSPEEISSMILYKMKEIAEKSLETNITHAVITVPAYFNDAQRAATKNAGTIAGLTVLRIINEPTAAAIAYGFNKNEGEKNILVFDLGGGTFDVSILTIENGVFEVLSTNGDTHLGGQDFDNKVTEHIIKEIKKAKGVDLSGNKRAVQKIRREAEKAKRALSKRHQTELDFDDLTGDGSVSIKIDLSRAKFEELNMEFFRATLKPLERVLADADLKKSMIDEVVLVGGSTRIPKVQQLVKEFFGGKEPNKGINPDEAVAYGAAIQGAIIKGDDHTSDLVLLDVNPLSLGIETQGGIHTTIIPRNTRIPVRRSKTFSTVQDNQDTVQINVFEGERQLVKHNNKLGMFTLTGIPKAPRGEPQIEVTFQFDQNGILTVLAEDKKSGNKEQIQISNNENRASQDDIERMIRDAEMYASEDKEIKERIEKKNSFEGHAYSLKSQAADKEKVGDKLSEDEVKELTEACEDAISWLDTNPEADLEALTSKHTEFEEKIKDLAQKLLPSQPKAEQDASGEEEDHDEL